MSDEELLEQLNNGSEAAFHKIYSRYWAGVFLVAKNRIKNNDVAKDIVQDIFYKLWRRRGAVHLQQSLQSYFAVAVKYEIINYLSRERKAADYGRWAKAFLRGSGQSTEETVLLNDLQNNLNRLISHLPERSQLVFKLQSQHGYSQKKIADELKISEKTVEFHLRKVRLHLKKTVKGSSFLILASLLDQFL